MERILTKAEKKTYLKQKETLIDALLNKKSLNEIVHIAAELLQAPIILTTSFYRVLVMDDLGLLVNDSVWQKAKETGYCGKEEIALFQSEGITRQVLAHEKAFVLNKGIGEAIPRILHKVIVGEKPAAYIGVFQNKRSFCEGDLAFTDFLCEVLSLVLEWQPQAREYKLEIQESILLDLLNENITSGTILNDRLRTAEWSPKKIFQCILITPESNSAGIDNADYVGAELMRNIPYSIVISVKEGLLLLINGDTDDPVTDCIYLLQELAEQYGLYMNISGWFRNLIHLKAHYEGCLHVRKIVKKEHRQERITKLEEIIFDVLTDNLSKEERSAYAQMKFLILLTYDHMHGSEYCHTLLTYIEHGCSVTESAKALYVHRNTMTKRLNRIKEIAGINIYDGRELIHFYLTRSMLQKR